MKQNQLIQVQILQQEISAVANIFHTAFFLL